MKIIHIKNLTYEINSYSIKIDKTEGGKTNG